MSATAHNTPPVWRQRWQQLAARERLLISLAAAVLLLGGLWWLLLAPAIHTLRSAPELHNRLDVQLAHMQRLQAQAQQLQQLPQLPPADAQRALQESLTQQLGNSAQYSGGAGQANIQLKGASPQALAQWLAQARSQAQAVPQQVQLSRADATGNAPARWNGSLLLTLPSPP